MSAKIIAGTTFAAGFEPRAWSRRSRAGVGPLTIARLPADTPPAAPGGPGLSETDRLAA